MDVAGQAGNIGLTQCVGKGKRFVKKTQEMPRCPNFVLIAYMMLFVRKDIPVRKCGVFISKCTSMWFVSAGHMFRKCAHTYLAVVMEK